jgi:hypothetical protein
MKHLRPLLISAILATAVFLSACLGTTGTTVTNAGNVVYATGPREDVISVTMAAAPTDVYDSIVRVFAESGTAELVKRNDESMTVEVKFEERSVTLQATEFGEGETLLFVWADAGNSGLSGNEVAISTIDAISKDIMAEYELVEN